MNFLQKSYYISFAFHDCFPLPFKYLSWSLNWHLMLICTSSLMSYHAWFSPWDVRGNLIRYYRITVQFIRVCRHDDLFLVWQVSVKKRRNLFWNTNLSEPLFASVNTALDNGIFYFSHYLSPLLLKESNKLNLHQREEVSKDCSCMSNRPYQLIVLRDKGFLGMKATL